MVEQAANENVLHCAVAQKCGACQQVEVPYTEQLAQKDARIAQLFADLAPASALRPILGMEYPYYYRNKVISPFAPGKKLPGFAPDAGRDARSRGCGGRAGSRDGRRGKSQGPRREILCGMYAAGTHRIIATDECLVENRQAKQAVLTVKRLMPKFGLEPYNEDTGKGFLRHAVVRVGHTSGEMLLTLVTNGTEFSASRAFCRELVRRCPFITTVVQNVNMRQTNVILGEREHTLYGPGFILDTLCGLSFRISSQSFYQVNAVQTEVLYRTAVELANLSGKETAIDAYCGTGTIGLVAAKHGAARVIGVESVDAAVRDARQNARHNGVENAEFVTADAAALMRELAAVREAGSDGAAPQDAAAPALAGLRVGSQPAVLSRALDPANTVLFMDPPRAGSSEEFLRAAGAFAPARIMYISCKPETQVRDIAMLRGFGYGVQIVQPVDMFPHTDHIESIAVLEKGQR